MDLQKKIKRIRRRHRTTVAACSSLVTLGLAVGGVCFAVHSILASIDEATGAATTERVEAMLDAPGQVATAESEFEEAGASLSSTAPFYTLIVGSDQREDETPRSDVIILARVAPEDNTVTLVSLPRDIMVDLDENGTQKLNAAYAFGGLKGALGTVKELSGLNISHYVEVDFEDVVDTIDALGGVDVDVPAANDETGQTEIDIIETGMQHLDGQTALAFARERYGYARGDFQRSDNQRLIIKAVIDKVMSKPAYEIPDAIKTLVSGVSTDLKASEIIALASSMYGAEDLTVYSAIAPCDGAMVDGVYYDILDEDGFAEMMELMDAGKDPSLAQSGDSAPESA